MIHGVLEDEQWTSYGLVRIAGLSNIIRKMARHMITYYSAGVQIGEFSDDAYYHVSIYTGSLFFGGIDGLLYLDRRGGRLLRNFIRIFCYVG